MQAMFLLGPTASGKSAAALALARHFPLELISVDSAQVYRGMDIGTAKPSAEERAFVPHHLIDLIEPTQAYSAARFVADAQPLIAQINARGRLALLVGGTMLYARALRTGLDNLPPADPQVREALDEEARRLGWPALHARLARIDPVTAARLPPTDSQRIQRALEVFLLAGRPMSALLGNQAAAPPAIACVALEPSVRADLHARIARRFDQMLAQGLCAELAGLRRRFTLHEGLPSMRCVGYRQAWEHLEGRIDAAQLREQGIAATRQLAKRQLTWLRSMPDRTVIDCLAPDANEKVRAAVAQAIREAPNSGNQTMSAR